MFGTSLIICVSLLIHGITAKPYTPWNKLANEVIQETIMAEKGKEPMYSVLEVEPPEDMDVTYYNIDPGMKIWKSMKGTEQDGKYQKAEEDRDELNHPSMADHNLESVPVNKAENSAFDDKPEVDVDTSRVVPEEPELDEDDKYHPEIHADGALVADVHDLFNDDPWPVEQVDITARQGSEVRGQKGVRLHLVPEEDMDDLYHGDPLEPVPYQGHEGAFDSGHFGGQLSDQSEPEEDLDELYHH